MLFDDIRYNLQVPTAFITGGAGFFGGILKRRLLKEGWECINIDLEPDDDQHSSLTSVQGDIRNMDLLRKITNEKRIDVIFHCAAILAHAVKDKNFLWTSNVDGTRNVLKIAEERGIPKIIYISTNCLWGEPMGRPVTEEDEPDPVEIYGRSKWEAEKILMNSQKNLSGEGANMTNLTSSGSAGFVGKKKPAMSFAEGSGCSSTPKVIIFRCPTIIDAGRLGLLAILFEFIDEGRKVWVVGGGDNRYQFIYAQDLADACIAAVNYPQSAVFNIGSDNVRSFRDCYNAVIERAGTGASVANFPRSIAIPLMKLAYALKLSPLGPYQYKMIAESFIFDTNKIKRELKWKPTLTNEAMLWKSYEYYRDHRKELQTGSGISAHRQPAKMGVIRLLKWLS